MTDVSTATNEGVKQTGRFLFPAIFALGGGLLFYIVFGDEISAFFDFQKRVDRMEEDVVILKKQIKDNSNELDNRQVRFLALEDYQGDSQGELNRLSEKVRDNTLWRIGQEKRATVRIEAQKYREQRLTKLERLFEKHEKDQTQEKISLLEQRIRSLENGRAHP